MLYIPKIDEYLEILTDEEVKDFVAKNFNETIKKEKNVRKVAESLYIVEILNLFYPKLQPVNTKPVIKNKLKKLLTDSISFRL